MVVIWQGRRERIEERGKRRTFTNSSSMKALQERLFCQNFEIVEKRSIKFSGGTWNLTSLEKRVCRAYRVRFGKNLSKAPTPWSPSHLPWLFKQHYLIKVFRAKAGKGGVLRDRRRECPTPWSPSHLPWLFKQHHLLKVFRAKAGKGGVISNRILQKKGFGLNGAGKGRLFSCKTSFLVWLLN